MLAFANPDYRHKVAVRQRYFAVKFLLSGHGNIRKESGKEPAEDDRGQQSTQ